jgi:hypothetical protein
MNNLFFELEHNKERIDSSITIEYNREWNFNEIFYLFD